MMGDIIFPTKWPLFELFIGIWKLQIKTVLMRPSIESMSYEYIALVGYWGAKELFKIRLFDSYMRTQERKLYKK